MTTLTNTHNTKRTPDALVSGGGSVYLVRPLSQAAREWLEENVSGERQYLGDSLAVEHRYICDLIDGMQAAGLVLGKGY